MEQRSDTWLEWRNKGIGSSDTPIILGVSPWMTPYQLWEIKLGLAKGPEMNWAMERGNRLEPKARAHYETLCDIDMPATLVEHPKYPFIRASLDGFNAAVRKILEIKVPGRADHSMALEGKVPEKYMPQVQHQLLAAQAEEADYFSYYEGQGAIVRVEPNLKMQKLILEKDEEFWHLVQTKTPPEFSDRDFRIIKNSEISKLFRKWKAAKLREEKYAALKNDLKKQITGQVSESRARCAGVRLMTVTRSGSIDYDKVPQLAGVDLEPYRKEPSQYVELRLEKKKK